MDDSAMTFFSEKSVDFSFENAKRIFSISNQWFLLMVKLNECPLLAKCFSKQSYGDNQWTISSTEYTRFFLSSGIIICEGKRRINDKDNIDRVSKSELIYIKSESELEDVRKKYEDIQILEKWSGCGMKLPDDVRVRLNPNIVWPLFQCQVVEKKTGKNFKITLGNTPNQVNYEVKESELTYLSDRDEISTINSRGFVEPRDEIPRDVLVGLKGKDKISSWSQGTSKGNIKIDFCKYEYQPHTALIVLPYTCPLFDLLTEIHYCEGADGVVLTTT